ncbi:MAG: homoserine dehydrogenase [Methanomassiliicoccaceae archaeon]|jgi:homoserine dehydrogenase|nr:homoserine dehydrogenase [Methanomassiliicoccaceae archaeon]
MRIIMAGFGTVGQGFAEVLHKKTDRLNRFNESVKIVAAFDSKSFVADENGLDPLELVERKKSTGSVGSEKLKSGIDVLDSVDYDVLVEVSPTNIKDGGAGLKHVEHALKNGKDVVTVNKGPLALKFSELNKLAEKKNALLRFEGSVGGAMPIINLCSENLKGERVKSIRGIFNGTCNFILSRMDKGLPFEQALKEAQQLGYAESDPSYDIDGIDTACKVVILANSIFRRNVTFSDVSITGITSVSAEAIALAAEHDMVIRLIGEVSDTVLEVSPRLIPLGHPLSVSGTLNIAQIRTDLAGPITVSGKGAGRIETASAILSDLIAIMDRRR